MTSFKRGITVITQGIAVAMKENRNFKKEIVKSFKKYTKGNWGDTCEEDSQMNDAAVKNSDNKILALYKTSKGDVFIITEWDRSATTILFADEFRKGDLKCVRKIFLMF